VSAPPQEIRAASMAARRSDEVILTLGVESSAHIILGQRIRCAEFKRSKTARGHRGRA